MVPPMAASLRASLAVDPENRLMPLWRESIRPLGQRVFDFDDIAVLGSSDCEFIDDVTGGESGLYASSSMPIGSFGGTVLSQSIDRDMVANRIRAAMCNHIRIVELMPSDAVPGDLFRSADCSKER